MSDADLGRFFSNVQRLMDRTSALMGQTSEVVSGEACVSEKPEKIERSPMALAMLCAWNGIKPGQEPPEWWNHPSDANRLAWERVADAARAVFEAEQRA